MHSNQIGSIPVRIVPGTPSHKCGTCISCEKCITLHLFKLYYAFSHPTHIGAYLHVQALASNEKGLWRSWTEVDLRLKLAHFEFWVNINEVSLPAIFGVHQTLLYNDYPVMAQLYNLMSFYQTMKSLLVVFGDRFNQPPIKSLTPYPPFQTVH